jgi:hypothetical protein
MVAAIQPRPPEHSLSVGSPTTSMYLFDAEGAQRELARRLEWMAVTHPELTATAKAAYWLAGRIRGDRLAVAA